MLKGRETAFEKYLQESPSFGLSAEPSKFTYSNDDVDKDKNLARHPHTVRLAFHSQLIENTPTNT